MSEQADVGLSDALRDLADACAAGPGEAADAPPVQEAFASREPQRRSPRDPDPGGAVGQPATGGVGGGTGRMPRTRRPAAKGGSQGLKATLAPLVGTVGMLLLVPAVWAVLVLNGVDVFASERNDSISMAKAMLVCWPIAICLIAASVVMIFQVMRERKTSKTGYHAVKPKVIYDRRAPRSS